MDSDYYEFTVLLHSLGKSTCLVSLHFSMLTTAAIRSSKYIYNRKLKLVFRENQWKGRDISEPVIGQILGKLYLTQWHWYSVTLLFVYVLLKNVATYIKSSMYVCMHVSISIWRITIMGPISLWKVSIATSLFFLDPVIPIALGEPSSVPASLLSALAYRR